MDPSATEIVAIQSVMDDIEDNFTTQSLKVCRDMYTALGEKFKQRGQLIKDDNGGSAGVFWWSVFSNEKCPMYQHVDTNDERVFRAVTDIDVSVCEEGIKITFKLSNNLFVENSELWRIGRVGEDKESTSSGVKWKQGAEKFADASFLNFFGDDIHPGQEAEIFSALVDSVYPNPLKYL
eukprot:PhM_4_TR15045/c0_g1_i1/m.103362/K11290/SET, TAF1, I2PP2A; template-activating factor I